MNMWRKKKIIILHQKEMGMMRTSYKHYFAFTIDGFIKLVQSSIALEKSKSNVKNYQARNRKKQRTFLCCCTNPHVHNTVQFWSSISRWEMAELRQVQKKTTRMSKIASANPPMCEDKIRKGTYDRVLQKHLWHGDVEKNNNFAVSTRAANEAIWNFIKTNKTVLNRVLTCETTSQRML